MDVKSIRFAVVSLLCHNIQLYVKSLKYRGKNNIHLTYTVRWHGEYNQITTIWKTHVERSQSRSPWSHLQKQSPI